MFAFLYWHPISTYLETKRSLSTRSNQVATLRAEHASLQKKLDASATTEALTRSARRLGYVRSDEQLFIVKGIPAWRRANPVP